MTQWADYAHVEVRAFTFIEGQPRHAAYNEIAGERQQILTNAIRTGGLVLPSNLAPPKYDRI